MILFTNTITPRLTYITNFISTEIGAAGIRITSNEDKFRSSDGPKINYSNRRILTDELWLRPHTLLFENTIHQQSITCFEINGNKAFFKTEGDFPFDVFAASFYLISRYEEYLPHEKDEYGRYAHTNSLAFKEEFLELPMVNRWLIILKEALNSHFSPAQSFRFLPTYDIDEAFSYKYKGWLRTAGATGKALLKGQWSKIAERKKVLRGDMKDPYDAFQWMDQLHEKYGLKPIYFFLVANKLGKYDRNIPPHEPALISLISHHASKYTIGVHPSWQSGDDPSLTKDEIRTIAEIAGRAVTVSRQHYIRFTLPQTFRLLIDAGIKEDYSLGYGTINGFRASVASSFFWYDLETEQATSLKLFPFCFMEANAFYEQKQTAQQTLEEMRHYLKVTKEVNGLLVTLWHNTFLGTEPGFAGWKEIYLQFISECTETNP